MRWRVTVGAPDEPQLTFETGDLDVRLLRALLGALLRLSTHIELVRLE